MLKISWRKRNEGASPPALARYDDELAARERFRIATAVSLASSAGLFITGFFLHQLDRPASEDINRLPGDPTRRTVRGDSASIRFAPFVEPKGFGAGLRGTF